MIILLSPYHPSTMPILSHSITLLPHYDIIRWVTSFLFSTRNQSRNTLWKSYQRIHSDRRVISRNRLRQLCRGIFFGKRILSADILRQESHTEEYSPAYRRKSSSAHQKPSNAISRNLVRRLRGFLAINRLMQRITALRSESL